MADIEKMDLASENPVDDRLNKLKELMPEVFSESGIDFDKLRLELGDEVDEGQERYAFTWPGKADAIRQSQTVSTATLRPCPEKSRSRDGEDGSFDSNNIYIEGDNLEVLKLLQRGYHGKVKMIYIDPPYNTGKDFVYKDKFGDTIKNYKEQAGLSNQANADTSGRYHSDWCSMMYPRLKLARELLSEDGILFISIDDIEERNLRNIADEVFGETNFIGTIVWNKRVPKNDNKGLGNIHEYVIAYSRCPVDCQLLMKKDGIDDVYAFLKQLKLQHVPIPEAEKRLKAFYSERQYDRGITLYNCLDENYRPWGKINMSWPNANTFGPRYDVLHPETKRPVKVPDRGWRWKQDTFNEQLSLGPVVKRYDGSYVVGGIWFAADEKTQPSSIKYLDDVSDMLLRSILSFKSDGGVELEGLFEGKSYFSYPKPTSLLQVLLSAMKIKDGIFVDFFSGSAASADALMRLNAQDGGERRMISVQLPETCAEGTVAKNNGYDNLCQLGEERIRRVGDIIKTELNESNRQLRLGEEPRSLPDIGFRVFALDDSGIERPESGQLVLDVVKSDRTELDIVFEMMLKWGLELTLPVEKSEAAGYPVWSVACDELVCCMSRGLTIEALEAIADMEPRRVLILDSVLDDTLKLNAVQIFKHAGERMGCEIELRTV
ncbi:MAG: site-specific DNA-methyltransferase [Phoenicibacter congonensis]|uniref:Site-specific DNA-methyltransferase n=1 Tax=Phoenicibacter congonensis TaxID=1944646 RepID=A0AA43UB16_9ACTN|nr:site-specific DNA-methyltransferase [Phoenicibacter congonensis]